MRNELSQISYFAAEVVIDAQWSAPGACRAETHPDSIKPLHVVVLIRKSLALDCIRFRDKFVSLLKHVSFRQLARIEKTRFQRSVIFE